MPEKTNRTKQRPGPGELAATRLAQQNMPLPHLHLDPDGDILMVEPTLFCILRDTVKIKTIFLLCINMMTQVK
jgi:hypothetical protein